jgi:hypothetical protein
MKTILKCFNVHGKEGARPGGGGGGSNASTLGGRVQGAKNGKKINNLNFKKLVDVLRSVSINDTNTRKFRK